MQYQPVLYVDAADMLENGIAISCRDESGGMYFLLGDIRLAAFYEIATSMRGWARPGGEAVEWIGDINLIKSFNRSD